MDLGADNFYPFKPEGFQEKLWLDSLLNRLNSMSEHSKIAYYNLLHWFKPNVKKNWNILNPHSILIFESLMPLNA